MSQVNDIRARYNANGNAVIPNTFQHPNIFIDKLMYYLTPEENVVLTFAVRRILGFQSNIMSRKDNISLSQFADGILSEDGSFLSRGCGIGVNTVRNCLENLEKYKILLPASEKPNPVKGQEYWLQDNENVIDWQGLEIRKEARKEKYKTQIRKATQKSLKVRGIVERKDNVERNTPVTSDDRQGVTSDVNTKPTETQRNPQSANAVLTARDFEEAGEKVKKIIALESGAGAWQGRELMPSHLLKYADWWNAKSGQIMRKMNKEWGKAFNEWYSNSLEISTLDEAYQLEIAWKKIIAKPSELTAKAIAIQALPKPAPQRAEGVSSGYFA